MAKTDLNILSLASKFIDIRESLPGDSFNWSWVRPLSQVKYLAIHHSASPDTQTPIEIANYHTRSNGWGGIGYHFVITKDGTVYYVGDIATARANVANLNEQVIGICLVGNFTSGRVPTAEQIDSTHKLCDFFINNYPDFSGINSWEAISGHKELPGQATTCPGDDWPSWKTKVISGLNSPVNSGTVTFNTLTGNADRGAQITDAYRNILGRDPDMGGLQTYTNSSMTIDQIIISMANSKEHKDLITLAKNAASLQGQVSDLQMSLASINGQLITLKETLDQREKEILELKNTQTSIQPLPQVLPGKPQDPTVTLLQAAYNLYKFIFATKGVS